MEKRISFGLALGLVIWLVTACGGSKETVEYEPNPFPEPEPVQEEPVAAQPETTEPVDQPVLPKEPEPVVLETIYFDFDRADLTPQARAIMAENARKLEEHPELRIRIEGHCDERGTVEYNLALGERRALAALNYLVKYGIDPGRISIISYGKERPVDPRHNEEAWARNRRAEFVILNQ